VKLYNMRAEAGVNLMGERLGIRRQSLHKVVADLGDPIRESADLEATLNEMAALNQICHPN